MPRRLLRLQLIRPWDYQACELFRFIGLLLALAWCLPWPQSQAAAPVEGRISYLVRLEHLQPAEDVCVLVRGDGQYHLEILNVNKIRIYEGQIDADELKELVRNLSKDALVQLQQSDVHPALVHWELDDLSLSVLRPGHWQNLHFADSSSQKPYDTVLKPLVDFLGHIQKKKGQPFGEESARSNCLPPTQIKLKTRDQGGTATARNTDYVLRISSHIVTGRGIEKMCTIVFPNGEYHRVRRSQEFRSREVKGAVADAQLTQDQISALREVLDADELKNYSIDKTPSRHMGEGNVTTLSIPRGKNVQEVVMWKYFDLNRWGAGAMPGTNEHGMKLLKPLNNWIKNNLSASGEKQLADPPNPECLPPP